MEAHSNYLDCFYKQTYNECECLTLSINMKTTVSLSSSIKSNLNMTKEIEQANTFLVSKALALYDISIPDDITDYDTLPCSPQSPLIKYKEHNFEGSSFTLN